MLLPVLITTAWLSLIIGLRYLLIAGGVWYALWGRGTRPGTALNRAPPSRVLIAHASRFSLLSPPIYAFPAAIALEAWKAGGTKLYLSPTAYPLWWLPV